ncbi:Transposon Ty3-I Gag-Pol polyprotein [Araneus ventricosus]|uniref:Transposon Ty3-I Gag-Pol polyprotein n=1 Tax=Araneus ventricosus TaxID=182803 RepID=A0A4Y2G301_ARAVE|nr:Transposon Ty3-I Gag-Pol polyprotein [Araneus ventricosus]
METAECQDAFELLKNKLVTKPVLQLYGSKLTLRVFCDASQVAILKQTDSSGNLHPVSYYSRTLRSYEKNYYITELECLVIVDALDKFYYYLHVKKFIIHTDHAALVWIKNVKNLRGRLFRWSLKLSMFDYEVKHLKGTGNVEADMLSRHPAAQYIQHSVHLLELDEIKTHQNLDNLDNSKYKKINDVLVLKKKHLFKIVVPSSLRRKVLQNAHEQFRHPGTQKMINQITPQYYWLHINQDISVFVKHCDPLVLAGSSYLAKRQPGTLNLALWLTTANRILRLYISTSDTSNEFITLVVIILRVYAPSWFLIKVHHSIKDGAGNLWYFICSSLYLPKKYPDIIEPVISPSAYFGDPENMLLTMLTVERCHIRTFAARRIIKAREIGPDDNFVRRFVIPAANFRATDYIDLIDWQVCKVTPSTVLRHISCHELLKMIQDEMPMDGWDFIKFPSHTQAVE